MTQPFVVLTGSFPGWHHTGTQTPEGDRNQDACGYHADENCVVVTIHDGCSGDKEKEPLNSELGSLFAAEVTPPIVAGEITSDGRVNWDVVLAKLEGRFAFVVSGLIGGNESLRELLVRRYLMFTTLVGVITPQWTTVAVLGDGCYGVNQTPIQRVPPVSATENTPPYLGYRLYNNRRQRHLLTFKTMLEIPTADLNTLLLGSDGLYEAESYAACNLPGKRQTVGSLNELFDNPRVFRPGMQPGRYSFTPWLRSLNTPMFKGGEYFPPLVEDDYSGVLIKRVRS